MMLRDVRDYVAGLGIAESTHCYCNKMPGGEGKAIGVYPQKRGNPMRAVLGGEENASYGVRAASFLVRWDKSPAGSERAAMALQEALRGCRETEVNGWIIKFIMLGSDEPIPVGTDSGGIYEYVLEGEIYYSKAGTGRKEREGS